MAVLAEHYLRNTTQKDIYGTQPIFLLIENYGSPKVSSRVKKNNNNNNNKNSPKEFFSFCLKIPIYHVGLRVHSSVSELQKASSFSYAVVANSTFSLPISPTY